MHYAARLIEASSGLYVYDRDPARIALSNEK